ncbi:hypothetical protein [Desulfolutivibrio sulfoxidireducens]|uniref:hypothetical protein n=1 Tax=Desulfolutivibrio sulfoxidireducens TaxID=2773299 RepID=UPI00159E2E05|nr:hypothetical protein [Desulfolutivibrio sulfoxidireducens]QLA18953.1 hypothetical protein GD604_03985 [Desulfolutivibrio sulfoxidireducens]
MIDNPRLLPVWELLGSTRQEYAQARPWKATRMSRAAYETHILDMPHEQLAEFRLVNQAERLVREIFQVAG